MKTHPSFICTMLMAAVMFGCWSCGTDEPSQPQTPESPETPGDNGGGNGTTPNDTTGSSTSDVLFFDDFEGTSSVPDTTKWVLCQRASSNWARYLSESYNQAYQKDGYLYLIGEKDASGQYVTGGIETRGKFDFTYGKVECRARFLRQPAGNHTGIWMMPSPPTEKWPKSGEIDIMEHLGSETKIYETAHSWYLDDMNVTSPKGQETVPVNNNDWNTYGVIWTPDSLIYTVNGERYLSYPNLHLTDNTNAAYQWPFDHPFYLILSQSLGGEGTWAGPIDNSALPAIFQIDWIRVTKQ